MEQQTREWFIARMGKITGTGFIKVLGSLRVRNTYIKKLIHERELLAGNPDVLEEYIDKIMNVTAPSLRWGNTHEDHAIAAFELEYDMDVHKSGFIVHPDYDFIGVSLDGFVHDNDSQPFAIFEAKCPYTHEEHKITLILGTPEKHIPQVRGNAWVAGMGIGYFISFDPRCTPDNRLFVEPIDSDPEYNERLETACVELYECVEAGKELLPPESALVLF